MFMQVKTKKVNEFKKNSKVPEKSKPKMSYSFCRTYATNSFLVEMVEKMTGQKRKPQNKQFGMGL